MKKKIFDIILVSILSLLFTIANSYSANFKVADFLAFFALSEVIFYFVWNKLDLLKFGKEKANVSKKEMWIFAGLIAFALLVSLIAYYPAYSTVDTVVQWNQAQTGIYYNWHPVMHTLIFCKLPSLFYNNILSSAIFQIGIIFAILVYFSYFLRKNFLNFKQTIFVLITIIFNPLFIKYSVTIWKDVAYSWAIFLGTIFLINIVITNGEWISKFKNKVWFIVAGLGVLFFRHNGIVPFTIMFIALSIFYPKTRKFYIVTLILTLAANFIITGPVYELCGIDSKTGGKSEMLGVVGGQLAYYYNNGVDFTKKEIKILDSVIPIDNWKEYYDNPRNFNYIKWTSSDFTKLADKHFNEFVGVWLNKSIHNPLMFGASFLVMTSPIYEISPYFSDVDYALLLYEETELYRKGALENISNYMFERVVTYNNAVTNTPLRVLFVNIGQGLFVIMVALALVFKRAKYDMKKLIPFTLVLINTMVIMCLITGEEYRYVYAQSICAMPLLIYGLSSYVYEDENKLRPFIHKAFFAKTNSTLIQFVRYIFVGGIAAIVNIGGLYILTEGFNIYYLISNILAFIIGLLVNYALSKKMVFQNETAIKREKEFMVYATIGIIGLGLDTIFVGIFTSILSIYYMLSKIISTILVFIWNFVARKVFYKIVK